MIDDTFFFSDKEETDRFGIAWYHKTRLVKYTDKKGNFLWWSLDVASKHIPEKSNPYGMGVFDTLVALRLVLVADSGVYDYTPAGTFFGLTEAQRSRALTKKISKPIPLSC